MNASPTEPERISFDASGERPPELNLAPFVDIVLQLICFYLFVAGSMQHYADPDVQLPPMAYRQTVERQPAELVVNIRADGSLSLNDRAISASELGPLLLERQQRLGPTDTHRLRVSIRVDRRQRYGVLEDVLETCRQIGLPRILLRAVEEVGP